MVAALDEEVAAESQGGEDRISTRSTTRCRFTLSPLINPRFESSLSVIRHTTHFRRHGTPFRCRRTLTPQPVAINILWYGNRAPTGCGSSGGWKKTPSRLAGGMGRRDAACLDRIQVSMDRERGRVRKSWWGRGVLAVARWWVDYVGRLELARSTMLWRIAVPNARYGVLRFARPADRREVHRSVVAAGGSPSAIGSQSRSRVAASPAVDADDR